VTGFFVVVGLVTGFFVVVVGLVDPAKIFYLLKHS